MFLEIVRKLNKVQGSGLALRSFQADSQGASMLVLAASYGNLKTSLAAYCMENSYVIETHVRGKSLELSCSGSDAIKGIAGFAATQMFLGEDAPCCVHFLSEHFPFDGAQMENLNMDQNQFSLLIQCDNPEEFKAKYMPILDQYEMGLATR